MNEKFLKRDLTFVLILVGVFIVAQLALFYLDSKSSILETLSQRLFS